MFQFHSSLTEKGGWRHSKRPLRGSLGPRVWSRKGAPCEKLSRPRGVHGGDQAICAFHYAPTPRRADMAHRRSNWPCWDQSLKDGHSGGGLQPGGCVHTGARAPSPSFASPKELSRKSSHPAPLSAFDDLERNSRFQNPRPFN